MTLVKRLPRGPYELVNCPENGWIIISIDRGERISGNDLFAMDIGDDQVAQAQAMVELLNASEVREHYP